MSFWVLPTAKAAPMTKQTQDNKMTQKLIVLTEEQLEEKICNAIEAALQKFANTVKPDTPEIPEDKVFTRGDICNRWNISLGTLHNYTEQGLITPIKLGRRVLFPMSEVLRAEANGLTKFKKGARL